MTDVGYWPDERSLDEIAEAEAEDERCRLADLGMYEETM